MAVPKLRFKEFNTGYISTTFEKLKGFSIQSGKSEDKGDTGEFPFYGSTGVIGHKNVFDYEGKSILIARVGANAGSLYQIDGKYSVSDNTLRLTVSDNISLDYLRGLLIKFNLNRLVFGTGQPLVTGGMIKKVNIFIPEFIEQNKIASFLSSVDEKISQLTQKHQLLSQYKQGMMQKLFSQQIRFKADDGNEFEEWEYKLLHEIANKNSIKNKDGSVTEVLTNSALQGIIKQSDYFDREIVTESNLSGYYLVNINDFVYNPRISVHAPVGPIKRNKKCLGVMSPLYTIFTVEIGNLTYLEYFFDSNFWHDYVKSVANSGARHDRMNITNKDFFEMPILYPCLEEQTKIANFLSAIDQKIEVVAQQIEQTKQWKKGLLQQMFV